ncbi:MAG: LL-diaminopimelate aminotransferase [Fastidiosipilaceae bacterium]|jgi:LL-diaminopimelate aminotransferase|nr:LL-diaminopimelate aminotransferase [Clostridiaceae bacterium]
MITINKNYLDLEKSYLFTDIARKVNAFEKANPDKKVIRLGIGDVTLPLPQVCVDALKEGAEEMGNKETFRGYGPEQGYPFLRDIIAKCDFSDRGIDIDADDIFVSDGAKSDTGNILDIFGPNLKVAVGDPVYPVYLDTNIMAGNKDSIIKLPCTAETNFQPVPPSKPVDLIYLCSPNNPTGSVMDHETMQAWVDYALENKSLILFDAAYEAFISDDSPHSIYEVNGAKKCAIEFRSFSKKAGFTGVRCGYTVVPSDLTVTTENGSEIKLRELWNRRQTTKFNGVSYIVQKAAAAVYTPEGEKQCRENIEYYLRNASLIKEALEEVGYEVSGGKNAPYVWLSIPDGHTSWSFFDYLLENANVVTTPGSGFGACGEGYIRISSFGSYEDCVEAVERIKNLKA